MQSETAYFSLIQRKCRNVFKCVERYGSQCFWLSLCMKCCVMQIFSVLMRRDLIDNIIDTE